MQNRFPAILFVLLLVSLTLPLMAVPTPALTEWSLPPGQVPFGLDISIDDKIWYACPTGVIGELDPPTNTFTEWPVVGSAEYPAFLEVREGPKVDGSEGKVFFTDRNGDKICTLDLDTDQVVAATVPTSDGGPMGFSLLFPKPYLPFSSPTHVIFVEQAANKIGRLDLQATQYVPSPAPRSTTTVSPTFNSVIPEINVVTPTVTPGNPNLPPPITPASPMVFGPCTEWSIPSFMTDGPIMITWDDTSYWFSTWKNYLGRLVGDDKIYVFGLPTASARTIDLEFDSAGNIWYTAGDFFQGNPPDIVGKMELATGTITEWTVPTTGGAPFCLAIDDSGMVWFTEFRGNKIGKLDPSTNTFYEFSVPDSTPVDISIDSNGSVWFTEMNTNRIGGLSTAGQMVPEFPTNMTVLIAATSIAILSVHKARKTSSRRRLRSLEVV